MRIRVCQVIPTLVQGGAEKQMSLLARHLDPEHFESHVVVLTHSGPLEEDLRRDGIHLHFIKKRGKIDPGAIFRLTKTLRGIQPDIVHTWLFAANAYGRWAARRANVPVVIAGERCVDPWKRWWHHWIDRQLAKKTDALVTNTSAVVDFYSRHGIPAASFTVIPNAVSQQEIDDESRPRRLTASELCERLGLEPRKRVVGAVGRLWPQKGYEDLVWAGELLRVAYEDVWFVILGDGPELERLQHFRDRVEAQNAVRFLGHRSDAQELIPSFDLLWNGSHFEGQSNTILEAMSVGVPVIATDIPGTRDLVVEGQTGHLYPLGDIQTLVKRSNALLKNDETRREMGEASIRRIQSEFSLSKMIDAYSKLYRRLVGSKRVT